MRTLTDIGPETTMRALRINSVRISVTDNGVGTGATFTLEPPLDAVENHREQQPS